MTYIQQEPVTTYGLRLLLFVAMHESDFYLLQPRRAKRKHTPHHASRQRNHDYPTGDCEYRCPGGQEQRANQRQAECCRCRQHGVQHVQHRRKAARTQSGLLIWVFPVELWERRAHAQRNRGRAKPDQPDQRERPHEIASRATLQQREARHKQRADDQKWHVGQRELADQNLPGADRRDLEQPESPALAADARASHDIRQAQADEE